MSQISERTSLFPRKNTLRDPRQAVAPGMTGPPGRPNGNQAPLTKDEAVAPLPEKAKNAAALVGGLGLGLAALVVGGRILGGAQAPAPPSTSTSTTVTAQNVNENSTGEMVTLEPVTYAPPTAIMIESTESVSPSEVAAQSVAAPEASVLEARGEIFDRAAENHGTPSFYLKALSWHRSQWTPDYQSPSGDQLGIMGLSWNQIPLMGPNAGLDPNNAVASVDYAAQSLQHLYANTGSWGQAITMFTAETNDGFGMVPVAGYADVLQELVRQSPWEAQSPGRATRQEVNSAITEAAARLGVPAEYLQSLAWARSGFDNLQISQDGNQFGLFGLHVDFSSEFFENQDWRSPQAQADFVAGQLARNSVQYNWTAARGYDLAMRDFILENANYAEKYEQYPETQVLPLIETAPWNQ